MLKLLLRAWAFTIALASFLQLQAAAPAARRFDVRDFGAAGDGATSDTAKIQAAVDACASAGGGQVFLSPGRYLSGTIELRSHVTFTLDAGARLIGTTNLAEYRQPHPPDFMPEAKWGRWHRALVMAENAEDFAITGPGIVDGNRVFDPKGEEKMRGPHTIAFANCKGVTIRDVSIVDSANYAVFFQVSDNVEIHNVKIEGGWDGVHWRGAPERWCKNVRITGCQFFTGDDSIAGRYWERTLIADCVLNSSCNGLRLIGPAEHLIVSDCLFYGPGLQPHRTSGELRRTNMLSGIILQPGAWDATTGPLDDVLISRVTMHDVAAPVTLWNRPGNTVGRVTVAGLMATGVYRSALSAESWSDSPITNLVLRDVQIELAGGGTGERPAQPVRAPGVDARPLPAWGIYLRNVQTATIEDTRLSLLKMDHRPALLADGVENLVLDNYRVPHGNQSEPLVTTNVARVQWEGKRQ